MDQPYQFQDKKNVLKVQVKYDFYYANIDP